MQTYEFYDIYFSIVGPNTPAQAESLQYSLEQEASAIDLHVNADKTEYICFIERRDISKLNSGFLKLMDKFTYLVSSVSSAENYIKIRLAKALTAIARLSVTWKSDRCDKTKRNFSK